MNLILIQSIFTVTKSGYIQIEEISAKAEQIIDYRLTIDNEAEKSFIYIEDGRVYSIDGNLNWRLQIWQDIIQDLDESIDMASLAMKYDQGIVGMPTGLSELDEKLGGLHK